MSTMLIAPFHCGKIHILMSASPGHRVRVPFDPFLKIVRPGNPHRHVLGAHVGDMKGKHVSSVMRQPRPHDSMFFKNIDSQQRPEPPSFVSHALQFINELAKH